nr:MAG TPA: hypothetical protein [Bacteriophage sp.]
MCLARRTSSINSCIHCVPVRSSCTSVHACTILRKRTTIKRSYTRNRST